MLPHQLMQDRCHLCTTFYAFPSYVELYHGPMAISKTVKDFLAAKSLTAVFYILLFTIEGGRACYKGSWERANVQLEMGNFGAPLTWQKH